MTETGSAKVNGVTAGVSVEWSFALGSESRPVKAGRDWDVLIIDGKVITRMHNATLEFNLDETSLRLPGKSGRQHSVAQGEMRRQRSEMIKIFAAIVAWWR